MTRVFHVQWILSRGIPPHLPCSFLQYCDGDDDDDDEDDDHFMQKKKKNSISSPVKKQSKRQPLQAVFESMLGSPRILSVEWRQNTESIKGKFPPPPPHCMWGHHMQWFGSTLQRSGCFLGNQLFFLKLDMSLQSWRGGRWDREVPSCREELGCVYSPIHTLTGEQPIRMEG